MAISKQLVELQGGQIDCQSEVGVGTTFVVNMPFAYEPRAQVEGGSADLDKPQLTGLRVLVVEDLEVNRMLLRQMLRNTGVTIFEAEHGKEALAVLDAHDVDMVLMDLHMPEMDGIEATKRIREGQERHADVPIVCLTADVFKETKEAIFAAGMNDFVTKPVELRRLHKVLHHWKA